MTEAEYQSAVRRESEEEARKLRARVAELEEKLRVSEMLGQSAFRGRLKEGDRAKAALAASGTEKPRCVCVGAECHHLTGGPCACGCQTPWDESQEDNEG